MDEELSILTDPATYTVHPDEAWERVKTRTTSGRFLAVVKELARFREDYRPRPNMPRSRVYKDDALLELASTRPTNARRTWPLAPSAARRRGKREIADGILAAVKAGLEMRARADAQAGPEPRTDAGEPGAGRSAARAC